MACMIKHTSGWRNIGQIYVNVDGVWKKAEAVYVYVDGVWNKANL